MQCWTQSPSRDYAYIVYCSAAIIQRALRTDCVVRPAKRVPLGLLGVLQEYACGARPARVPSHALPSWRLPHFVTKTYA